MLQLFDHSDLEFENISEIDLQNGLVWTLHFISATMLEDEFPVGLYCRLASARKEAEWSGSHPNGLEFSRWASPW